MNHFLQICVSSGAVDFETGIAAGGAGTAEDARHPAQS